MRRILDVNNLVFAITSTANNPRSLNYFTHVKIVGQAGGALMHSAHFQSHDEASPKASPSWPHVVHQPLLQYFQRSLCIPMVHLPIPVQICLVVEDLCHLVPAYLDHAGIRQRLSKTIQ